MRVPSVLIVAVLLSGAYVPSTFAIQASPNSSIQYNNNGSAGGATFNPPGGIVYSTTGQANAVAPQPATSADVSNVLYGNATYQPFSVLPNGPAAGSANAVNAGQSAYTIVSILQSSPTEATVTVTPGGGWTPNEPIQITGNPTWNGTYTVHNPTSNPAIFFINSTSIGVGTTVGGGYVVVSAASGVTEPSWFMSNVGGTRYLEAYNTTPQGSSSTTGTGFANAQWDWIQNLAGGPPNYAVSPLYNWIGGVPSANPTLWSDVEGTAGLTVGAFGGVGPNPYGPATPAQWQTDLATPSACASESNAATCAFMATIFANTSLGVFHVGHFNQGMITYVGSNASTMKSTHSVTGTPFDSLNYSYTDVPWGSTSNVNGLAINETLYAGGYNLTGVQVNMAPFRLSETSLTGSQLGGMMNLRSSSWGPSDNFIMSMQGACDGINNVNDQGCAPFIGNLGEQGDTYRGSIDINGVTQNPGAPLAPYPYVPTVASPTATTGPADGRTLINIANNTTIPSVLPAENKWTVDVSQPYTAGQISTITALQQPIYTDKSNWTPSNTYNMGQVVSYSGTIYKSLVGSNIGNNPYTATSDWQNVEALSQVSNNTGLFLMTGTSDANWQLFNSSFVTFITQPLPPNFTPYYQGASNTLPLSSCQTGSSWTYVGASASNPNIYPTTLANPNSAPICIQVNDTSGFAVGESVRIAGTSCLSDAQIVALPDFNVVGGNTQMVVSGLRCQLTVSTPLTPGYGQTVVAGLGATGLALAASNDTWSANDTGGGLVEEWLPVVYSASVTPSGASTATEGLFIWQDNTKDPINTPVPYRGRALTDTTDDKPPCVGTSCTLQVLTEGAGLVGMRVPASGVGVLTITTPSGYPGTYGPQHPFNPLVVTGTCTGSLPILAFAPNSSANVNEVSTTMIKVISQGSGCSTVTVSVGPDVPNPYQIAPAAMTESVYLPPPAGSPSTANFTGQYLAIDSNAYASCPSATWSSSTTYSIGTVVFYGTRYYSSLANGNTGNEPDTSTSYWATGGPSTFCGLTMPTGTHIAFSAPTGTTSIGSAQVTALVRTPLEACSTEPIATYGYGQDTVTVNIPTTAPAGFPLTLAGQPIFINNVQGTRGIGNDPFTGTFIVQSVHPVSGTFPNYTQTITYLQPGICNADTASSFNSTSTASVGFIVKQAHYMTQRVSKDSQFGQQQFNPSPTVRTVSEVSMPGDQGGTSRWLTLLEINNLLSNNDQAGVALLPPGKQAIAGYDASGNYHNNGQMPATFQGVNMQGTYTSSIRLSQPPATVANVTASNTPSTDNPLPNDQNGRFNIGAAFRVDCNDSNLSDAIGSPCYQLGPISGSAPFWMHVYSPPYLAGSSIATYNYNNYGEYGEMIDTSNNRTQTYLNGYDMVDYYGPTPTQTCTATGCPTVPATTQPTMVINYNGATVPGNIASGATIEITQGGTPALWGVSSLPPSGSCLAGSIWSATSSTLYVCESGGGWTAIGSGGGGSGITALTGDVTASGTGSVAATVTGIQTIPVSGTAPTSDEGLFYDGAAQYVPGFADANLDPTSLTGGNGCVYSNAAGAITEDPNCMLNGGGDLSAVSLSAGQVSLPFEETSVIFPPFKGVKIGNISIYGQQFTDIAPVPPPTLYINNVSRGIPFTPSSFNLEIDNGAGQATTILNGDLNINDGAAQAQVATLDDGSGNGYNFNSLCIDGTDSYACNESPIAGSIMFVGDAGNGITGTSDSSSDTTVTHSIAVTTTAGAIANNTNCIVGNSTGGVASSATPLCSTVYYVNHLTSGTSTGYFPCYGLAAICPAGLYRITGYASVATASAGEVVTYTFTYADGAVPGTTLSLPVVPGSLTLNAGATGNRLILDGLVLYSDGTQNITYNVSASGSATWLEALTLEKIQ